MPGISGSGSWSRKRLIPVTPSVAAKGGPSGDPALGIRASSRLADRRATSPRPPERTGRERQEGAETVAYPKGRPQTPEHRAAISEAMKGRKLSKRARRRISHGMKRVWAERKAAARR